MFNFLHKEGRSITKSTVSWSEYAGKRLPGLINGAPYPELTFLCGNRQTAERLAAAFDKQYIDQISPPELMKFSDGTVTVRMVFAKEEDLLSYAISMASGFGSPEPMHLSGGLAAGLSEANGKEMRRLLHIPAGGFSLGSAFIF